jgi:hypothetical protein
VVIKLKKNKLFLAILIVVIIIEICTSVILILYKKQDEGQVIGPSSVENTKGENTFTITNSSDFLKLDTGATSKSTIIHVVNQYITMVIPTAYTNKEASDEDLKKIYDENIDEFEKCGIFSYTDLYSLMSVLEGRNIDFTQYESVQFNDTTITGNVVTVSTSVMYKSGQFITINFYFVDGFAGGFEIK